MRKIISALTVAVSITGMANAITLQEFYYQKGFEKAKEYYYQKGLKDAFEIIKKRLQAYKKDLLALEVGKYLYENQLITYPRIYRILKDDGSVEIKVEGCKIEEIRSVDKILAEGLNIPTFTEEELKQVAEGNQIINLDNIESLPTAELPQPLHINLDKTERVRKALEEYNVPYEETDQYYRAVFFEKEDLERFCNSTKVCKR